MSRVIHADCRDAMRALIAEGVRVDAIVTDPPYGLEFMGKAWDSFKTGRSAAYSRGGELDVEAMRKRSGQGGAGPSYVQRPAKRCRTCGRQAWSGSPCTCESPDWEIDHSPLRAFQAWTEEWARLAYDILKPGGYLLAFGGTRTYHRMACAIEDAGFEIRDQIGWIYGSGFPKSLDVSKAIDKAAGAEGERGAIKSDRHAAMIRTGRVGAGKNEGWQRDAHTNPDRIDATAREYLPATDAARQWAGWGTALKPAWEPVCMARKPLSEGNVAANVLKHGTGAINVDACRIEAETDRPLRVSDRRNGNQVYGEGLHGSRAVPEGTDLGRWPANICHDGSEEVVGMFPQDTGISAGGSRGAGERDGWGMQAQPELGALGFGDTGSAARFFYCAKADQSERAASKHPTVKPIALMQWLVRMVAPRGALILDPFAGSGTTVEACMVEQMRYIAIEREAEYVADIHARIERIKGPLGLEVIPQDGCSSFCAEGEPCSITASGQCEAQGSLL